MTLIETSSEHPLLREPLAFMQAVQREPRELFDEYPILEAVLGDLTQSLEERPARLAYNFSGGTREASERMVVEEDELDLALAGIDRGGSTIQEAAREAIDCLWFGAFGEVIHLLDPETNGSSFVVCQAILQKIDAVASSRRGFDLSRARQEVARGNDNNHPHAMYSVRREWGWEKMASRAQRADSVLRELRNKISPGDRKLPIGVADALNARVERLPRGYQSIGGAGEVYEQAYAVLMEI